MYYRTASGSNSLANLNLLIEIEEAGGSKFVENKVATVKTAANRQTVTNVMKFLELDGPVPPVPVLVREGDAAPAGKTLEWTGIMLVSGSMRVVTLYR